MLRSATGGNRHHVMNRGARRLRVFGDEHDHTTFLGLLGDSLNGSDCRLHGYALMPNHFHLLLEANVAELGRVMKSVTGRYAQRFNFKYGYDGPLFRSRYRSKPITDDRQLLATLRYIHRNPLPKRTARWDDLRWTSHPAYVGRQPTPPWLSTSLLGRFATAAQFDDYVLDGDPLPVDDLETLTGRRARGLLPSHIEDALGVGSEAELAVLRRGGRGVRNDLRLAALLLSYEHADASLGELGNRYGYTSGRAARSAVGRARQRLAADPGFATLIENARIRLRVNSDAAREESGV
jgi:REP element-mobilizing transposase RayT